jgi:spore coat protein U-like protein
MDRNSHPGKRRLQALFRLVACAGALALVAVQTHAATLAGSLTASIVLASSCLVVGAPGATAGINLGSLDFGNMPATFTGTMSTTASGGVGGGVTQLLCSPDVTGISLTINGGLNPGMGGSTVGAGSRAMRGVSTNGLVGYLPYEIYSDAGFATPFPLGTAVTGLAIPATGLAISLPVFARVSKAVGSAALPAAAYTDTLVVTLSY